MNDNLPRLQERASLRQRAIDLLQARIVEGYWAPGERLPTENELAETLGVSRTVVRDALRTLATRGLVDVRQGVGTTVAELTDEAYVDAIALRLARTGVTVGDVARTRELIERMVAVAASQNRTDEDLARMRQELDELGKDVSRRRWTAALEAHLRWHMALIDAAHLPVLEILLGPMQRIILSSSLPPDLNDLQYWDLASEEAIYDAIVDQNPAAVEVAMRRHFAFVHDERYAERFKRPFMNARSIEEIVGR